MLNHLVNHQNTQLKAETKKQASNRHIYSLFLCGRVVFTVLFFVGNTEVLQFGLKIISGKIWLCSCVQWIFGALDYLE